MMAPSIFCMAYLTAASAMATHSSSLIGSAVVVTSWLRSWERERERERERKREKERREREEREEREKREKRESEGNRDTGHFVHNRD